jgi:hypothetical protein
MYWEVMVEEPRLLVAGASVLHSEQAAAAGILHFEQVAAVGIPHFEQVAAVGIPHFGEVAAAQNWASEVGTRQTGSDMADLENIQDSASGYFDASLAHLGLSGLTSLNGCHHRGFECLAVLVSACSVCWLDLHQRTEAEDLERFWTCVQGGCSQNPSHTRKVQRALVCFHGHMAHPCMAFQATQQSCQI